MVEKQKSKPEVTAKKQCKVISSLRTNPPAERGYGTPHRSYYNTAAEPKVSAAIGELSRHRTHARSLARRLPAAGLKN